MFVKDYSAIGVSYRIVDERGGDFSLIIEELLYGFWANVC